MTSGSDEEGKRFKVSLLTIQSPEYLVNFPRIPTKPVKIIARLDLNELDAYINKV
jgi:hypothetical protein